MIYALLGILSGLTIMSGDILYISHVLQEKTKPHRVTWFVFTILNLIDFSNQLASGATNSLWVFGGASIATLTIFILSFFKGVGGYTKRNILIITGAILGCALWFILHTPLASILTNVVVATLALIPTFAKSFSKPETETKLTWFTASLSGFLAAASINQSKPVLYILPLYAGFIEGILFIMILIRLKQKHQKLTPMS